MNKRVYLKYIAEFKSYGIKKDILKEIKAKKQIAEILLPQDIDSPISPTAPHLGFLLGEDKAKDGTEYYSVGMNYLQVIKNTGVHIRFLDYEMPTAQLTQCDGLILPGGNFDFPKTYFIKRKNLGTGISKRFKAYQNLIKSAYKKKMPMLGICAGAQMIGTVLGKMKMHLQIKEEVAHAVKHKPTAKGEVCLHTLKFYENTPILKIMNIENNRENIKINSRHEQAIVWRNNQSEKPLVKLQLYAVCKRDNIPEIWGNEKTGILCVQGHPEDLAAAGNQTMQSFYNWITDKAKDYREKHKA